MPIFSSLITWLVTKRKYQIDFFRKYPVEVQNDTLTRLIRQARSTAFAREHGMTSGMSYPEFAERVPVRDYPGLKPWIDKCMAGESDILWPGEVRWFAKSSGTTGDKSKFIPVTEDILENCHFRGGKDTLALANITGAVVFQSTIPVSIGLLFTDWSIGGIELLNIFSVILMTALIAVVVSLKNKIPAWLLLSGGLFYFLYIVFGLVVNHPA